MFRALTTTIAFWLFVSTGWSCQVPVFRYALERWTAGTHRLLVTHQKPLSAELQKRLIKLQSELSKKNPSVNLELETVDLSALDEQARWSLPDLSQVRSQPSILLVEPSQNQLVFHAPATPQNLQQLLDSPARRQWVKHIVDGASVVWLVLPGQNDDSSSLKTLQAALRRAESEIKIPDGVMRPDELKKRKAEELDKIDLEDVLRSPIPLKISFPVMEVDRTAPEEAAFIAMLTHGLSDAQKRETLVIPLFGRGRMLEPLPASMLTEERILAGCRYLCGACSCQVKEQNPGRDIVISEDWSQHLQDGLIVIEKSLPPLEGVGDIADESPVSPDTDSAASAAPTSPPISRSIIVTLAIVLVLLVGGTILVMRKT